jgi:hypothetical protein
VPIARADLGPSAVDLLGPWARRVGRRRWTVVGVLVAAVAVAAVAFALSRSGDEQLVVRGPLTFNTRIDDRVTREPAQPGELLRLAVAARYARGADGERTLSRGAEELVYRDGGPAPSRPEPAGAPIAQLAIRMVGVMRRVRAELGPDARFQLRGEGRVKIGKDNAGWLARYQFRRGGRTWFGVRVLLMPDVAGTRSRVLDLSLRSQSSPVVPNIRLAGSNGPMRTPFYGVAFGTEAP